MSICDVCEGVSVNDVCVCMFLYMCVLNDESWQRHMAWVIIGIAYVMVWEPRYEIIYANAYLPMPIYYS